ASGASDGQRGEGAACRIDRGVEDRIVVSNRYEACLISRRREVHARVEHLVKERVEARYVALRDFGKARRNLVREVEAEHAAEQIRRERYFCFASCVAESLHETRGACTKRLVEARCLDQLQRLQTGRQGDRVARQRA